MRFPQGDARLPNAQGGDCRLRARHNFCLTSLGMAPSAVMQDDNVGLAIRAK
jgi:hypothetical protein